MVRVLGLLGSVTGVQKHSIPQQTGVAQRVRPWICIIAASGFIGATGCGRKQAKVADTSRPEEFVPGSFLVQFADSESRKSFTKGDVLAQKYGCDYDGLEEMVWNEDQKADGASTFSVQASSLGQTWSLHLKNCDKDIGDDQTDQILDQIASVQGVEVVEAEGVLSTHGIVENDPYLSYQWGHNAIRRNQACEMVRSRKKQVIVAVIDSGLDRNSADLADNLLRINGKVAGINYVGKGATQPGDDNWDDCNGHGTHTAGIIAAASNNGQGISGVAGCANVKIVPIRVMNCKGKGNVREIERGVIAAIDKFNADIINLSIGGDYKKNRVSSLRSRVYDYAASKNVAVFAAAGNSSKINGTTHYSLPASYYGVMSVTSSNAQGGISDFAVRGSRINLIAPGDRIISTFARSRGANYKYQSGTSMATPYAAGAYAIALSSVKPEIGMNSRIDVKEVEKIMLQSVRSREQRYESIADSAGILDAVKLMDLVHALYPQGRSGPEPSAPSDPFDPSDSSDSSAPRPPAGPVVPTLPDLGAVTGPFEFANLTSGQQVNRGLKFNLRSLPTGTRFIGLYWGVRPTASTAEKYFELVHVKNGANQAESRNTWSLSGTAPLYGVAYDARGKMLRMTTVNLDARR